MSSSDRILYIDGLVKSLVVFITISSMPDTDKKCQEYQRFMFLHGTPPYDARHEKTDLKVFVVVIPKEGWAHVAAPILQLV